MSEQIPILYPEKEYTNEEYQRLADYLLEGQNIELDVWNFLKKDIYLNEELAEISGWVRKINKKNVFYAGMQVNPISGIVIELLKISTKTDNKKFQK